MCRSWMLFIIFALGCSGSGGAAQESVFGQVHLQNTDEYSVVIYDEQSLIQELASSQTEVEVHDTDWQLIAHGYGDELLLTVPSIPASIKFEKPETTITAVNGFDGCNGYWGQVTPVGDALNISYVATTRMACNFGDYAVPPANASMQQQALWELHNEQYQFFIAVRDDIQQYRIVNDLLFLTDSQSSTLVLQAVEQSSGVD